MIAGTVIIPTVVDIMGRANSALDERGYSDALENVHDGAIQVESALVYLSQGKNPYVESYVDTPLKFFGFSDGGEFVANPALDYFVYLPGFLVTSLPVQQVFSWLNITYDQRWVYLVIYIGLVLILPTTMEKTALKLPLLIAVALNPLVANPVKIGMNDVVILFLVVVSIRLLQVRYFSVSALVFAFACTFKQSAWFIAPFYLLLLWGEMPAFSRSKHFVKNILFMGAIFAIIVLPFALWDFQHFFEDIWVYPSGGLSVNYPIRGYTIGTLLVGAGIIETQFTPFPFGLLQLVGGIPFLALLLRWQWQENNIGRMMFATGTFIFILGFASRFFQDNYVGFVVSMLLFGLIHLWEDKEGAYNESL
jgi:hypothetical protein